jgi:peptidoglycan/LPS O-acetylase OafA/YrhL
MTSVAVPAVATARITAFDGLRGVAAVIVVVFHYLCLLHPSLTPPMGQQAHWLADTPLGILWNGNFWVAVFFVLSGFVMAAAANRRRGAVLVNSTTRYLRLALPATASCLLAFVWLSAFPESATSLGEAQVQPSEWLEYTYQEPNLPFGFAVADGMIGIFVRGFSRINNVLWTMQIELFGSLAIFGLYALTRGWVRLASLVVGGVAIVLWLSEAYLGFIFGAALYEAHRRGLLQTLPALVPVVALVGAVILGGPGQGAHLRLDLPPVPESWQLGEARGAVHAIGAALLLLAVLTLPTLSRLLDHPVPVFLGRISFGLYLVHVPPLYTVVAWALLQGVPEMVLAPVYLACILGLAWVFTLLVDEPLLRQITAFRNWLTGKPQSAEGRDRRAMRSQTRHPIANRYGD